jgi:hypothetical protein
MPEVTREPDMQRFQFLIGLLVIVVLGGQSPAPASHEGVGTKARAGLPSLQVVPLSHLAGSTRPAVRLRLDNGRLYTFALELGLAVAVIDASVAQATGLPFKASPDQPASGTLQTRAEFETGGPKLGADELHVGDFGPLRKEHPDLDGLFGSGALRGTTFRVDLGRKTLTIARTAAARDALLPRSGPVVPLIFHQGSLGVSAVVDGKAVPFKFNTGAMESTVGSWDLTGKDPKPRRQLSFNLVPGIDGRFLRLDALQVGAAKWSDPVLMTFAGANLPEALRKDQLGMDFLARFRTTIDLPAMRALFEPDPLFRGDPLCWVGIGTNLASRDGQLVVASVASPSPAAEAGVRDGDLVLAIDGNPVAQLAADRAQRMIIKPVGRSVELTIRKPGESRPTTVRCKSRHLL